MRLTFLGGADEVGASSTLVEIAGKRLLIDAGIRISPRSNRGIQNDQLPDLQRITEAGGPDVILVTHAHTDHTGALPLVMEQYPHVPVMATRPTQVLTRILQKDAQRIMKTRQDEEGELPIFDEVASDRLMAAFQTVEFHQAVKLGEALQVTFHPAGHIAGAAMLVIESEEGTLVMTGDVSLNDQRAVVSAAIPNIKADALVMESTYGGKLHANRDAEEKRLIESLKAVTDNGGKALIPAFALGRSQEILQIILAYRDVFDAPVYVDGMVRSVCQGYATFDDLLPRSTVRSAGEDPLFFRKKVRPVTSAAMREQVANSDEPCVIVASSGMLTGGASVAYAKQMAPHSRNAIFLTGYQDEEAPGRRLQEMLRKRQSADQTGESVTIKIDGKPVSVRCHVDTYSLSAHADEMELVNMAETFGAEAIMLVHGDHGARHSVASALRQRGHRVITPKIGQTKQFGFPKRPWALAGGQKAGGTQTAALDPAALWEALKGEAGNFYSARELAQMWWGDATRAREVQTALEGDIYFAADWRRRDHFQVRTPEQVARKRRQLALMMAYPDLVGSLVALRDSNERLRLGVVVSAGDDYFEAEVAGAKGRQYPADALLWVFGKWEGYESGKGIRGQVSELLKKARPYADTLLPFARRQKLVAAGAAVMPPDLLPPVLPDDLTELEALVALVAALAGDGATLEAGGLLPHRAREGEPLEQNQARDVVLSTFPPDARLRKVGMDVHRRRLLLTVDFPDYAARVHGDLIEDLEDQTGWNLRLNTGVNQQALGEAVHELLPAGAMVVKGPSFYMDKREVGVELSGVDDLPALQAAYHDLTGYRLITSGTGESGDAPAISARPTTTRERMEINAAYGLIRAALDPFGLYKVGLKQDAIVLTFISPQIGERHTQAITRLAEQTGYPLRVHPHPNQQKILQIANQYLREAGWVARKGPGIHTDRGAVSVTLASAPDSDALEAVCARFVEQTGYALEIGV
ncbi:MAG: MBL fold metallo-hydrolase [Anaerolineaceae bacterium]|nr:MAG: MBL fold metallo-hydrolase [Anaerolineaceae bacterium]